MSQFTDRQQQEIKETEDSLKIIIEVCNKCSEHQWHTKHDQDMYNSVYDEILVNIQRSNQNAIILKNLDSQGQPFQAQIGAFEIIYQDTLIYSKLRTGCFPDTVKIIQFLNFLLKRDVKSKLKGRIPFNEFANTKSMQKNKLSKQKNIDKNIYERNQFLLQDWIDNQHPVKEIYISGQKEIQQNSFDQSKKQAQDLEEQNQIYKEFKDKIENEDLTQESQLSNLTNSFSSHSYNESEEEQQSVNNFNSMRSIGQQQIQYQPQKEQSQFKVLNNINVEKDAQNKNTEKGQQQQKQKQPEEQKQQVPAIAGNKKNIIGVKRNQGPQQKQDQTKKQAEENNKQAQKPKQQSHNDNQQDKIPKQDKSDKQKLGIRISQKSTHNKNKLAERQSQLINKDENLNDEFQQETLETEFLKMYTASNSSYKPSYSSYGAQYINLCIGGFGVRTGGIVLDWLCQEQNALYNQSGQLKDSIYFESLVHSFFTEKKVGSKLEQIYVPNAVFIDTRQAAINNLINGEKNQQIYRDQEILLGLKQNNIFQLFPSKNPQNVAIGSQEMGCQGSFTNAKLSNFPFFKEYIIERIRKVAEEKDKVDGFICYHSLCGGTGSAISSELFDLLKNDYQQAKILSYNMLPTSTARKDFNNIIYQHDYEFYNFALGQKKMSETCDMQILFDNYSLLKLMQSFNNTKFFDMQESINQSNQQQDKNRKSIENLENQVIQQDEIQNNQQLQFPFINYINSYLAEIMLSQLHFKTSGSGSLNLREYIQHFTPHKNLHFAFATCPYFYYDAPENVIKQNFKDLVDDLNNKNFDNATLDCQIEVHIAYALSFRGYDKHITNAGNNSVIIGLEDKTNYQTFQNYPLMCSFTPYQYIPKKNISYQRSNPGTHRSTPIVSQSLISEDRQNVGISNKESLLMQQNKNISGYRITNNMGIQLKLSKLQKEISKMLSKQSFIPHYNKEDVKEAAEYLEEIYKKFDEIK